MRQPLYCLAGPSGTGKSTVGHALLPRLADRFVVLEQDVLWVPELRDPAGHHRAFRSTWLRLAATVGQSGRPVCLRHRRAARAGAAARAGHFRPGVLPRAHLPRRRPRRTAADAARVREWDEPRIVEMLEYAAWLDGSAATLGPPVELLDTTERWIEETADAVCAWLAARG